jgi:hypothetical protein
MLTVDVRVRRALFVAPERWSKAIGFTRAFRRRLRLLDLFEVGTWCSCPGLPVRKPLPFGRTPNVYRVKAAGVEGDRLVVYLA